MMPRLDGFGLLQELRADPALGSVPIILLSARAGEEARIEGVKSGADDYIIKPFSTRELLARVDSQIRMAAFRREAERSIRESERRFRQVAESLPQLVWTCTPDGLCDYLGPQWCHYTGRSEAGQLGYGWLQQLHPSDRERVAALWQATAAKGENFEIEFRIRRHDGAYRWFRTLAAPLRDEAGNIAKWFGTNTDVDELKRAEEALRASEERYRGIFQHAGTGIAITDIESHFQSCNPAYAAMLGYTEEELRALIFADLVHPEGGEVTAGYAPSGLVWKLKCPAGNIAEGRTPAPALDKPSARMTNCPRVLVVEDEPVIAAGIAAMLGPAGFEVIGPAGGIREALSLLEHEGCDIAVLDVILGSETSESVARELIRSGTPFVIISGYSREQLPEFFRAAPFIHKPLQADSLQAEIKRCVVTTRRHELN
jgi:PAS domain S-box-containing protein